MSRVVAFCHSRGERQHLSLRKILNDQRFLDGLVPFRDCDVDRACAIWKCVLPKRPGHSACADTYSFFSSSMRFARMTSLEDRSRGFTAISGNTDLVTHGGRTRERPRHTDGCGSSHRRPGPFFLRMTDGMTRPRQIPSSPPVASRSTSWTRRGPGSRWLARDTPCRNAWRSNSPVARDDAKSYHCDITFLRQGNGRHRGGTRQEDRHAPTGQRCRRDGSPPRLGTSPRSRVIRGKTPGSYGRSSPVPDLTVFLLLAALPGLVGPQGREAGRAGRHRVAARLSNGEGTMSGRYYVRRSRLER